MIHREQRRLPSDPIGSHWIPSAPAGAVALPSTEMSWMAKRRMMVQIIPNVILALPSTISAGGSGPGSRDSLGNGAGGLRMGQLHGEKGLEELGAAPEPQGAPRNPERAFGMRRTGSDGKSGMG